MSNKNSSLFTSVPTNKVNRNLFDLGHEVKMSGKFGILYPQLLMDVLPGDTVRDQMTAFIRMAPMLAPVMHRIDVITHFFFVPNRILSDHWEDFITGGQDGAAAPILPYITPAGIVAGGGDSGDMDTGTLWDYLGLPVSDGSPATSTEQITAFPFWAYIKIWNDYYRDPNLDQEIDIPVDLQGDVSNQTFDLGLLNLRNHMWQKDYLTSALPWAQRGAEVLMPLSGLADTIVDSSGDPITGVNKFLGLDSLLGLGVADDFTPVTNFQEAAILFDSSGTSINDLRRALAIQTWMETNARGGGRYVDQIESHFNTRVPDFRLQRAEYLGGGKQPVTISQVLATAAGESGTTSSVVGEMGGHGISVGKSNRFTYRCQEHGWIIGITVVQPQTAYQQGLDKMWTRQDKYDHAWPELANLGEQEILSKEAFFDFAVAGHAANQSVFGYIPRYSEYKFKNDRVSGDFRNSLNIWTLSRIFTSRPVLEPQFTTMYDNDTTREETFRRIFYDQTADYLWMQLYHHLTAKRPLPYFGVPKIK